MKNDHKVRVCIFIGELTIGGAEKQAVLLARALKDHYHVEFIVLKGHLVENQYARSLQSDAIPFHTLRGSLPCRIWQLYRLFRRNRFQIVFTYLAADILWGSLAGRLAGIPFIVGGIRNEHIPFKKRIALIPIMKYLQNAVIVNSRQGVEYHKKYFRKPNHLKIIENCIEVSEELPARTEHHPLNILQVGRFIWKKDYETAIRCISYLYHQLGQTNICYHIAGYGSAETSIRQWLCDYQIEPVTQLHIKPDYLAELYRTADIYLSSSVEEGFPNTIMEAMSHGLPIVATIAGDTAQLVTPDNGFLSPRKDFGQLAAALHTLCNQYHLRIRMGNCSYEKIKKHYTMEAFRAKYEAFLQELLQSKTN